MFSHRRHGVAASGAVSAGAALTAALALAVPAAAVPPSRISRMTFVSSAGAFTELTVQAEDGVVNTQTNRAALQRVHAQWNGNDGSSSLDVTCDQGEVDLATNDFTAVGHVRGKLGDGRRFEGPWMRYDRAKGIAWTDAPIEIVDQGRTLRGGGFRYQVRTGRLRLTAGASVSEQP
jgi:LPS export ABC transporter protein LptC